MGERADVTDAQLAAEILINAENKHSPIVPFARSNSFPETEYADSVADNAGAARVVLGARARRSAELVDLSVLGCVFRHRGGVETAAGGKVMGHPVMAIIWLAPCQVGVRLSRGAIVLSGGLTPSVMPRPNEPVTAEFDGWAPPWSFRAPRGESWPPAVNVRVSRCLR